MVLNHLVAVDEILVRIAQKGFIGGQMEKKCPPKKGSK
jgi:hypothetical protein